MSSAKRYNGGFRKRREFLKSRRDITTGQFKKLDPAKMPTPSDSSCDTVDGTRTPQMPAFDTSGEMASAGTTVSEEHKLRMMCSKSRQNVLHNKKKYKKLLNIGGKKKKCGQVDETKEELALLRFKSEISLSLLEAYRTLFGEMGLQQALRLVDPTFPLIVQ